jgi:primosomal protein N' (replication factor Y)
MTSPEYPQYAEIALPLPLRQTFTYAIPPAIRDFIALGARAIVPFGNRRLTGYVVALSSHLDEELGIDAASIKGLSELVDESPLITDEILRLARWTADYYAASWGEVLKASLPAGINSATENIVAITDAGRSELLTLKNLKSVRNQLLKRLADENGDIRQRELEKELGDARVKRAVRELANAALIRVRSQVVVNKVKPKLRKAVRLMTESKVEVESKPLTPPQQKLIDALKRAGGEMMFTDLAEVSGASPINTLAKRGLVEVFISEVRRDPLAYEGAAAIDEIELNAEQSAVLKHLTDTTDPAKYAAFLLHGVTGSGKTEVYMRAMRHALDRGKASLMLVPVSQRATSS